MDILLNGVKVGTCNPDAAAACGVRHRCMADVDVGAYTTGSALEVRLVNSPAVTATKCDGAGKDARSPGAVGSFLLAADLLLLGCSQVGRTTHAPAPHSPVKFQHTGPSRAGTQCLCALQYARQPAAGNFQECAACRRRPSSTAS